MNYLTSLKSECDLKLQQEQKVENKTPVRIVTSVFILKTKKNSINDVGLRSFLVI